MREIVKSRCGWCCSLCCVIGIIALVFLLIHRADDEMHSGSAKADTSGDAEPGSKKFDHIEVLNIGPVDLGNVKIILGDQNGNELIPAITVGPLNTGEPVYVPVLQDLLGVKMVTLEYQYTVAGENWLRTRTLQVFEPATEQDFIRAVTFWARMNEGPDQIPEFWGQALIVNMADQRDNTVVPIRDPGPDVEVE